jgi:hypothetical protein
MALSAIVGIAQALEGREAAAQATHQALDKVGRNPVVMGLVIASHYFPIQPVINGVSTLLGDVPLLGLSSSVEITADGPSEHSVVVALLTGEGISIHADWFSGFSEDGLGVASNMAQSLQLEDAKGSLFVVADGFTEDTQLIRTALPQGDFSIAGCLASGSNLHEAKTYQIGGRQFGSGGLAAAFLKGNLVTGVGYGHGWQPVGVYFQVTRSDGPWIRTLDDKPVSEIYATLFNYPTREWTLPPLNELVRLYPLGIEQHTQEPLLICSPLRMEEDGSMRMNKVVPEGRIGHLLVGSIEKCVEAAQQAAHQALDAIGKARPILALLFTDVSWHMLFNAQPGRDIQSVREIIGSDVPIAGGYTFGQIVRTKPGTEQDAGNTDLLNQHIEIAILAEKE